MGLQQQGAGIGPEPAGGGEEVLALDEPVHKGAVPQARARLASALAIPALSTRDGMAAAATVAVMSGIGSGRQALATMRATGGNDLAAITGRHARTKAVPAGAHELARLISALHGCLSAFRLSRPDRIASLARRPRHWCGTLASILEAARSPEQPRFGGGL
ncbi:hypothetical protein GCM10017653_09950 [Ancylobacter defluvii]|uniref:Uncharacterized protein n=1 Tax=Ancylobacter defluvii TaxID=1282440 RepID=A0A9W6JUM3_9HYPH|nr:hypothetical protein GCM10017653_09950 [Ancylobacter defluvii]